MQLVDTHCHIHSTDYSLNADEVIERAREAEVTTLLCVGTSAADSELAVQFVQNRPNCYASVGLHPHEATDGQPAFASLQRLVEGGQKVVAVGECGLDYFYTHSPKSEQATALRFQIELAMTHNLPLIFHVREAFDDFWSILADYQGVRGVVHSFTDTQANLDKALAAGFYIGVNGIATFTKNDWQLEMYKSIPRERIIFETDAPFLTPAPLRGKINEPMQIRRICEFLAMLRQESVQELADSSTQGAKILFGL